MAEYGSSNRTDTSSTDTAVNPVYLQQGDTGNSLSLDAAGFGERESEQIGGAIEAMKAAYVTLTTSDTQEVRFDPGLDISEVIGVDSRAQHSFPLPNGATLGSAVAIGLPQASSDHRLVSIRRDSEERGLWLEISCKEPDATARILLSTTQSGREALIAKEVIKQATPTHLAMQNGYKEAQEKGSHTFDDPGLDISEVIGAGGKAKILFPLPNGETLRKPVGIGLPQTSSDHRLVSISQDSEERGLWLEISCKDKDGDKTRHVLLTNEEGVTKNDAIICKYTPTERAMRNGYKEAQEKGSHRFDDPGLDISEVIGVESRAQHSFPLPNGETLGSQVGIGLPKTSRDQRLVSIRYNEKENSFLLVIRVLDKYNRPLEAEVTVSGNKGIRGKDAIKPYQRSDCTELPKEFEQRAQQGLRAAQRLGQRAVEKKDRTKLLTSVKGECFEQLMGVLLAGQYPDEQILPQYCLDVDKELGYYGMRVDFKVGDTFFEIKWGMATENIRETYNKHTAKVDPQKYVMLCLCKNAELDEHNIPYTLFSSYIQNGHPLAWELDAAMEQINQLVMLAAEEKDQELRDDCVDTLVIISDYLYDTFHRVGTCTDPIVSGEERIEALRKALTFLTETVANGARRKLIDNTTRYRSPLEAYFHIDDKLHRQLLPLKQLHDEEPDRYDLGYYFTSLVTDEDGEQRRQLFATFASKQDFALICTLFFCETRDRKYMDNTLDWLKITGEQNEHGWFVNPTFTVTVQGDEFSFSRDTISNPDELNQLAAKHGLLLLEEDLEVLKGLIEEHQADAHAR